MPRRPFVLAIVLLSTVTFPLTITGASLALSEIKSDLDASLSAAQWVVNGYNACFAAFLVVAGSLADVLGRRRVFVAGVALYCVAGLVPGLVTDIATLNVVRALGGIGAAAAVSAGGAILAYTFDGAARTRAFGLLGTTLGVGLAFGPTIAGFLVDALGWRGVFIAPAACATVVLALAFLLPEASGDRGRRVDWWGAATFTAALSLSIAVLVQAPQWGLTHPLILGGAVAAGSLLVVFARIEKRHADPMFDVRLLATPGFRATVVAAGAIVFVMVPLLVYLPSYLIAVVGLSATQAGVWLLMLTVPTVLLPTIGSALSRRVPTVVLTAGSVALTGLGALGLITMDADSAPWEVAIPFVLTGAGFGLSAGLLDGLAISSVPTEQSGTAAGVFNASRLSTETVGIAAVGALLSTLSGGRLAGSPYTDALHLVCLLLAGCAALVTVVLIVDSRRTARHPRLATHGSSS